MTCGDPPQHKGPARASHRGARCTDGNGRPRRRPRHAARLPYPASRPCARSRLTSFGAGGIACTPRRAWRSWEGSWRSTRTWRWRGTFEGSASGVWGTRKMRVRARAAAARGVPRTVPTQLWADRHSPWVGAKRVRPIRRRRRRRRERTFRRSQTSSRSPRRPCARTPRDTPPGTTGDGP